MRQEVADIQGGIARIVGRVADVADVIRRGHSLHGKVDVVGAAVAGVGHVDMYTGAAAVGQRDRVGLHIEGERWLPVYQFYRSLGMGGLAYMSVAAPCCGYVVVEPLAANDLGGDVDSSCFIDSDAAVLPFGPAGCICGNIGQAVPQGVVDRNVEKGAGADVCDGYGEGDDVADGGILGLRQFFQKDESPVYQDG